MFTSEVVAYMWVCSCIYIDLKWDYVITFARAFVCRI